MKGCREITAAFTGARLTPQPCAFGGEIVSSIDDTGSRLSPARVGTLRQRKLATCLNVSLSR
jgi:hypothetical protein